MLQQSSCGRMTAVLRSLAMLVEMLVYEEVIVEIVVDRFRNGGDIISNE